MNDTIKTGSIAGILGTIGDNLIHYPAYFMLGTTTTGHYISQLILPFQTITTPLLVIAELVHFIAGAVIGVLFFLLYKTFGFDYPYYKGLGLGITLWVVHIVVIPNMISPRPIVYRSPIEAIVDLMAHALYSLITAAYLAKVTSRKTV